MNPNSSLKDLRCANWEILDLGYSLTFACKNKTLAQSVKVHTDISTFEMIRLLSWFYTDLVLWYKTLLVSEISPLNNNQSSWIHNQSFTTQPHDRNVPSLCYFALPVVFQCLFAHFVWVLLNEMASLINRI